jgi:site-specific DNA-methyltransferase (adenine-specific)
LEQWKDKRVIGNATLYLGDCLAILPALQRGGVIVTDPPYLDGDLSASIHHFQDYTHRIVLTPGKLESFNWIRREKPVYEYAWKCSGTKSLGGAACLHILFEPILAYCMPRRPLGSDLLDFPLVVDPNAHGHPWPKPLSLFEKLVAHWTDAGETVVDPYMGSATTGVAAIKSARNFIGIEIEPKYFEIACERIENAQRQERLFA